MALLKFKRSAVPAKIPSIADLDLGELAINTYDGKVYTKKDDGTQAIVEVGGGGGVQTIASADGSVTVTGTTDIDLSVAVAAATTTIILPVRNNTGATLAKGTAVYINGALGQNPTVTKAIATGDATSAQTLGLMTADLSNNSVGNVTLIGTLTNLNTSAYSDGQQLYLSPTTAGALTATKPYAPNHLVYMAVVEHAHPSLGKLFVKVQNGYEMDELHDVSAQNPANNDGLFYNTSTSLWEKKSIPTALGYTPVNRAGDTMTGQLSITGAGNVNGGNLQLGDKAEGTNKWSVMTGAHFNGVSQAKGVMLIGSYSSSTANQVVIGGNVWEANPATQIVFHTSPTTTHATGGLSRLSIDGNGAVTASVDIRSPIYYDSNDTAYFVDPNNTSVLNALIGTNYIETYGELYTRGNIYSVNAALNGWNTIVDRNGGNPIVYGYNSVRAPVFYDSNDTAYYVDPATNSVLNGSVSAVNFAASNAFYVNGFNYYLNSTNGGWYSNARIQSETDMRAPIFYDSDNTAFYVNPASGTVLGGSFAVSGNRPLAYSPNGGDLAIQGDAGGWATGLYFRGSAGTTRGGFGALGGGDGLSYLWAGNAYNDAALYLYAANYAESPNSFRAPIFYDSNNTGYYLDPASTSNLVGLTVSNTITGSISGNAATVSSITNITGLGRNSFSAGVVDGLTSTNFRTTMFGNAVGTWNIATSRWNGVPTAFSGLGPYGTAIAWSGSDTHAFLALNYNSAGAKIGGGSADNINWSADLLHSANYTSYAMPIGSSATNSVDVRAPIFYDSNDTSFYVDPSVNSVIRTLYLRNGSIQSKFAETSNFGYSSSYKTVVLGNEYLTTISMGVDVSGNASGSFNGQGEGREVLFRNGVTFITPNSANNGYLPTFNMTDGYVTSGGSVRSPIFYDSDNTTYYLDPASGFNFQSSGVTFSSTGSGLFVANAEGTGSTVRLGAAWSRAGSYANGSYTLGSESSIHFWISNLEKGYIDSASNLLMNGSVQAPIFYDSANTNYYLDLNGGGSQLRGRVNVVGAHGSTSIRLALPAAENGSSTGIAALQMWCSEPGNTWNGAGFGYNVDNNTNEAGSVPAYYFGRINTSFGQAYMRMEEVGHWHFYNTPQGSNTRYTTMSLYNTGYALAHQSFRAPIFYDSDNTGFYLDPNTTGTSLNVAGSIVAAGNVTAYSDIRIKDNVETIPSALGKLDLIRGVTYTRTDLDDKEQRYAGVIAQEIEAVLPEAVRDLGNIKAVDYNATIALLIQAVKELRDEVEALKK